ncbi:MAG: 23S rRNA (pseudouridine(1915)-N(3))-methyltransferase RlmH [Patescibacteria group bacterium]
MRIRILAVGRLREDYLRAAAADYAGRLRPYAQLEVVEVPGLPDPARPTAAAVAKVRGEEAALLLRRMKPDETLVALDPGGRTLTSEEFAAFLQPHEAAGKTLVFAVGGSWGLGRELLERAAARISLSAMTFPHGLARVILMEQLFRAFRIMRGEVYHK